MSVAEAFRRAHGTGLEPGAETRIYQSESRVSDLRRYIESALRLKIRLILAAVLVFAAALVALSLVKQGLTSSATVWVEKPIVDNNTGITDPTNLNAYISAATYMSGILDQLLGTNTFKLTIAQKAHIPIRNAAEQDRVLTDLDRNLRVE